MHREKGASFNSLFQMMSRIRSRTIRQTKPRDVHRCDAEALVPSEMPHGSEHPEDGDSASFSLPSFRAANPSKM
jgi:hypothetical protein